MGVDAFDTVLITGAGPVGLGGVVNTRFRGARVLVAEGHPWRRDNALELGAEAVLDPARDDVLRKILELTDGAGVDKSLDCSGVVQAHRLCIDATRRRGHVAFVGECGQDTTFRASPDLIRKGLSLHGSWHYNLSLYPKIMQVIRSSPVAAKLISHVFPLSEVQQAFTVSASHDCAKILLKAWE
jgi:L-iditol 2-dehydrogenase